MRYIQPISNDGTCGYKDDDNIPINVGGALEIAASKAPYELRTGTRDADQLYVEFKVSKHTDVQLMLLDLKLNSRDLENQKADY